MLSWLSRRMERPELLAAFYPGARAAWREELALAAIFAAALREDASYVDVGTNRGQLLEVAVRTAPRGRHLAFEPIPELAAEVDRRFPNVDCRRLALSSRPGTHEFWHFRRLDGWSGLVRNPTVSDSRGDPQRLQVEVSTLDAQLENLTPALVKIDVEGAELEVLEGGRGVLARHQTAARRRVCRRGDVAVRPLRRPGVGAARRARLRGTAGHRRRAGRPPRLRQARDRELARAAALKQVGPPRAGWAQSACGAAAARPER